MATERLFGNRISPACKYCAEGLFDTRGKSVLCPRNGVVDPNFKCRHFFYNPLSRIPKRPPPRREYDKSSFSLEEV